MSKVVPRSLLETCVKKFLFLVKRVKRCHPKRRATEIGIQCLGITDLNALWPRLSLESLVQASYYQEVMAA